MHCRFNFSHLTPSFHPARGIRPTTDRVTMVMFSVAKKPVITFFVARVITTKASEIPTAIPCMAVSTSSWKEQDYRWFKSTDNFTFNCINIHYQTGQKNQTWSSIEISPLFSFYIIFAIKISKICVLEVKKFSQKQVLNFSYFHFGLNDTLI